MHFLSFCVKETARRPLAQEPPRVRPRPTSSNL